MTTHLIPSDYVSTCPCGLPGTKHDLQDVTCREAIEVRAASARNYAYEATMGDYSMGSINRAQDNLDEAKRAAAAIGLTLDDVTVWVESRWGGSWQSPIRHAKFLASQAAE